MRNIRFLVISDLHFKSVHDDKNKDAINYFLESITKTISESRGIDFILFSGDIVFSGKKEQYEEIKSELFDNLVKISGIDNSKIFITPGNHDIDLGLDDFPENPELNPRMQLREKIKKNQS